MQWHGEIGEVPAGDRDNPLDRVVEPLGNQPKMAGRAALGGGENAALSR
jgi:hypothetical protein